MNDINPSSQAIRESVEPPDYYFEGSVMVFTAHYLLKRGTCCGNGCRHCPYPTESGSSIDDAEIAIGQI